MTADEMQSIVRRLANSSWCRYWINWSDSNHPLMAVQCRNAQGVPEPIRDAAEHGLTERDDFVYTAQRTKLDGSFYESKLF